MQIFKKIILAIKDFYALLLMALFLKGLQEKDDDGYTNR